MCLIMVMGDPFGGSHPSAMYLEESDINPYGRYCKMILNLLRVSQRSDDVCVLQVWK
jgi:hypothetical protein